MSGLGYGYFSKNAGYFFEPFFVCDISKSRVHFGCLVIFAFGSMGEILFGGSNHAGRESGCRAAPGYAGFRLPPGAAMSVELPSGAAP